ncbi:MAG TPA: histidine phosphatase family protein [Chloroflexota bacterium]|nr:histidine phosphatase family protein [Chloroflexota bacterium]
MQLYFVRHGESTANLLHEFANSGFKHPLTERGVAQAHTLARKLSGLPFTAVYASPVMRAVQTAEILAARLHTRLEITEALREWSVGIYEGTSDPVGWELHRQVQEDWFIHHKPESKMPGGESWLDIQARFVPFIEGLVQEGQGSDRKLLLVAHGGLYMAMLPAILTNVDFSLAGQEFPYTACTVAETRPSGLHCLSWCDRPLDN